MKLCGLVSGLFPKKLIPLKLQQWVLWLCIFYFPKNIFYNFRYQHQLNTSFILDAGRGKFRGVSQNNAGLQDEGDVQAEHGGARRVAAVQAVSLSKCPSCAGLCMYQLDTLIQEHIPDLYVHFQVGGQ